MRKCALFVGAFSVIMSAVAGELSALAFVESSGRHAAIGDDGKARGAYQFHQATWSDITKRRARANLPTWDWQQATNPVAANAYATTELKRIRASLEKRLDRPVAYTDVYAVWNLGFAGYAKRGFAITNCPTITRRAAQKFETAAAPEFSSK